MPYYRFAKGDIFHNRIKTYPKVRFDIYGGVVYYNGAFRESGSFTGSVPNVLPGHISLYEMNVDRSDKYNSADSPDLIYAFLPKDSNLESWKNVSTGTFNQALYGDEIALAYPLSASISREYYGLGTDNLNAFEMSENRFKPRRTNVAIWEYPKIPASNEPDGLTVSSSFIGALRNTFNYYASLSPHYVFSSSLQHSWNFGTYDKGHQEMNMIYIPSIFYGSSIKKGSVSLKWYVSGTLMAECVDRERNGELIQVSGSGRPSANELTPTVITNYADTIHDSATGSVAGVVLYNEGVVALTGTWSLHDEHTDKFRHINGTAKSAEPPKWTYFAVGTNDGSGSHIMTADHNHSSSFTIEFEGINHVPVMTMFAHAKKGYLNFSNNPTFISGAVNSGILTGNVYPYIVDTNHFKESETVTIKNTACSSYSNHSASFKKQTYISKIGVYDENMNLIAIAKLATPVKKTEERDLTFKLKLDY